jgi:hypothetical protein
VQPKATLRFGHFFKLRLLHRTSYIRRETCFSARGEAAKKGELQHFVKQKTPPFTSQVCDSVFHPAFLLRKATTNLFVVERKSGEAGREAVFYEIKTPPRA